MYKNPMTLSEFMQAWAFDDEALGLKIGRTRVSVSRYRRGLKTPSAATIVKIVDVSEGQVTANDLLGIQMQVAAR
jgi:hypothetical protein